MYTNIGRKIKALAKVIGIGGAIICAVTALLLFSFAGAYDRKILYAYAGISILSCFLCIISSWPLYGFGELIDKADAIEKNTRKDNSVKSTVSNDVMQKIAELKQLKINGVITDEEYNFKERQLLKID